jgi:3'(2'), 5'-bisphosphate nucleotidase
MWLEHELAVARAAAEQAARLIMEVYASDFAVDWKGEGDPVTVADRRANDHIVRLLRAEFANDAICSEEGDSAQSALASSRGGRCWFVDPLDGTREFVSKNGEFSVMIGLAIDGCAVLGCVRAPVWEREYFAVANHGAKVVSLADAAQTERPLVAGSWPAAEPLSIAVSRSHLAPAVRALTDALNARPVACGSVGLKVALVLEGRATLYAHSGAGAKLWDGCAPLAIASEAGLVCSDANGRAIGYHTEQLGLDRGIVVAPQALHSRVIETMQQIHSRK